MYFNRPNPVPGEARCLPCAPAHTAVRLENCAGWLCLTTCESHGRSIRTWGTLRGIVQTTVLLGGAGPRVSSSMRILLWDHSFILVT